MPLAVLARLIVVALLALPAWWLASQGAMFAAMVDWILFQGMCDSGCEGAPHPALNAYRVILVILALAYVALGLWWALSARRRPGDVPPP